MGRSSFVPTLAVPTLETERLILRGHGVDDFGDSAAMWAEPEVVRHIGGRPFTREESWSRLLRYIGHWSALGFGYWVGAWKGLRDGGRGRRRHLGQPRISDRSGR